MKINFDEIMNELIKEIDNISIEEYLKYHEDALKMKENYEHMMKCFINESSLIKKEQ